jgi:hypothetical protein
MAAVKRHPRIPSEVIDTEDAKTKPKGTASTYVQGIGVAARALFRDALRPSSMSS